MICAVAFCARRRAGPDDGWWMCGPHWRCVPKALRARLRAISRAWQRKPAEWMRAAWSKAALEAVYAATVSDAFGLMVNRKGRE